MDRNKRFSLPVSGYQSLARIRVIFGVDVEQEPAVLEDDKIAQGEELLETLQGTVAVDETIAMCNLLIKK